jgi:hypothetical protein
MIIIYSPCWNHKQPDEEVPKEPEPGKPNRKGNRSYLFDRKQANQTATTSARRSEDEGFIVGKD